MQTLVKTLTDAELARLHVSFEVPLTISRIINDEELLDDEARYALHERFDHMSPGKALIAIALCAQIIAARSGQGPILKMLTLFSHQAVEDLGQAWLSALLGCDDSHLRLAAHANDHHTIDDLESLRDLLFAACHEMDDENAVALCVFLANEADVHTDDSHPHEHDFTCHHDDMPIAVADNVVPFPGRARELV